MVYKLDDKIVKMVLMFYCYCGGCSGCGGYGLMGSIIRIRMDLRECVDGMIYLGIRIGYRVMLLVFQFFLLGLFSTFVIQLPSP